MTTTGQILILGSNGSLGTELAKIYLPGQAVAMDRDQLDITDLEQIRKVFMEVRPALVYNCAAYTAVDQAEIDYDRALLLNGTAPGYLAGCCAEIGATLVHFSTGMVFKGDDAAGYNEDAIPNPLNAYGRTKLAGEQALAKSSANYYIIRTEWLYAAPLLNVGSPGASVPGATSKKSFNEIMLDLAAQSMAKGTPLKGVEDEFGRPTWARDLALAARGVVESGQPFGIYHLANSGQASRLDWAREIFKIKNLPVTVEPVSAASFPPRPAPRAKYELLNNTKLSELRPWQEALAEYLTSNPSI
jgi:dTDP-4-dehydrorhamnose reductase